MYKSQMTPRTHTHCGARFARSRARRHRHHRRYGQGHRDGHLQRVGTRWTAGGSEAAFTVWRSGGVDLHVLVCVTVRAPVGLWV